MGIGSDGDGLGDGSWRGGRIGGRGLHGLRDNGCGGIGSRVRGPGISGTGTV